MSRRSGWSNSRSRRPRFVQRRVLGIDRLEDRRLFCCSLVDGTLERSFQDEDWDSEDQLESDSERDLLLAASRTRVAVARSDDAEGENDEWDDEDEDWEYPIPTAPIGRDQLAEGESDESETQVPASPSQLVPDSGSRPQGDDLGETDESEHLVAARTRTVISFVSVVIRDQNALPDRDDSTVAEVDAADNGTSASGEGKRTASASSEGERTASASGEGENIASASGEGESAAAVPVRTPDRTVAAAESRSVAAATPRPAEVKESPARASSVTREDVSGRDVDEPSQGLAEASRQAMPPLEQQSRGELRPAGNPPANHRAGHASNWAASFSGFLGVDVSQLRDTVPQDLTALETALQDLLADSCEVGWDVVDWLLSPDVIQGILAGTIAVLAAEIVRQKWQQARAVEPPLGDGLDRSLGRFPELLGLPPGRNP